LDARLPSSDLVVFGRSTFAWGNAFGSRAADSKFGGQSSDDIGRTESNHKLSHFVELIAGSDFGGGLCSQ
jgi:hypothetical protein